MTRRRALAVFAAAIALLLAIDALIYSLYRSEVDTVAATLDDRLIALGATTARWAANDARNADAALAALVAENRLEDAYIVDPALHVLAGVRTRAGTALNLLRVDQDRLEAALGGSRSVGNGYSIGNARVEAAYFPLTSGGVLALEAGAEYHAPAARVRTTYLTALGLTLLVAAMFAIGLWLALRALERARLAYGRAERLAAVGQMAAMVAHEVRNPLGILRGQVELAREKLPTDTTERERERYVEMLAEIDRLNHLTEEFMALARDVPLDRTRIDVAALVAAVAGDLRIAHPGARLDATSEPVWAEADGHKLRQAIHNLIANAVQVGGAGATVRVETVAIDGQVRITVTDDGPGVPAELAATLFEPFVSGRSGGTGLGLAIARRVAERHSGTLVLESAPGTRGARFSIYLPGEA